jgi:Copper transport outer membrane protein, MctB
MFDLRYHVASLAAVFVALLIGILVGVGLTGKVDDAEKAELRRQIEVKDDELRAARESQANSAREDEAVGKLVEHGYPLLMDERLTGKRIGLIFIGSTDQDLRTAVTTTLDDAGARNLTRVRALKVPIDAGRVNGTLRGSPALARYAGDDNLQELGRALADEFVQGGDTPAWDALTTHLVVDQSGTGGSPLDGVVVARTAGPQKDETADFLTGLYGGLADAGAPAVGVETTGDSTSAVRIFDRADLSTVDNVDTPAGRLALALLLAGAERGNYGVKETATEVLPEESLESG